MCCSDTLPSDNFWFPRTLIQVRAFTRLRRHVKIMSICSSNRQFVDLTTRRRPGTKILVEHFISVFWYIRGYPRTSGTKSSELSRILKINTSPAPRVPALPYVSYPASASPLHPITDHSNRRHRTQHSSQVSRHHHLARDWARSRDTISRLDRTN